MIAVSARRRRGSSQPVPTHVALLRGINLGRRNRVSMPDLRDVVASLGHDDVATYIQSGNVVFSSAVTDVEALAAEMEAAIAARLGIEPAVVVLSREELARVVARNPFGDETDPKRVHAIFFGDEPRPDVVAAAAEAERRAAEKGGRDRLRGGGRVLYLWTPDGYGRSHLAAELSRLARRSEWPGTARNWATVTRLLEMLEA
jgi:uncharacterized protein (DUF1697 family)